MQVLVELRLMKRTYAKQIISAVFLGSLVISCNTLQTTDIPGGSDLISATAYLYNLKQEGKLPGIKKEDRGGTFRSVPIGIPQDGSVRPMKLTVKATVKDEKELVFWYCVAKTNQNSDWQLVEAWQADQRGKRVDLPIGDLH